MRVCLAKYIKQDISKTGGSPMPTKGYIGITYEFRREGRRWVGCCKELGTATFGRSIPETSRKLNEAVLLHLNTLEDVGERERFFQENSVEFHHTRSKFSVRIPTTMRRETFYSSHIQQVPAMVN